MSDSQLIAELRTLVDPLFNGIIFNAFACGNYVIGPVTMSGELTIKKGIYTLLFVQAMWSLHTKGNKGFCFSALIGLWISVIFAFVVFWVTTWNGFVAKNGSPLAIGLNTNAVSPVLLVFTLAPIFFADGILIWRCNILWGSRYILAMLLILYVTSIGAAMMSIIPTTVPLPPSLFTLSSLFSAITTLLATFLLVLKIVLVTRESRMQHSYTKILQILIESAGLVSFVMLSVSILALIDDAHPFSLKTKIGTVLYELTVYIARLKAPVTGIAPTLIAFRLADRPAQTEISATNRTAHPSHLTFRRSAHHTGTDSQALSTHISTIRVGSIRQEYHTESHIDVEDQVDAHSLQERSDRTQQQKQSTSTVSV